MEMWYTWDDELHELQRQEEQMHRHHQNAARCREIITERQRYLLQKDLAWRLSCWRDELQELVCQEAKVASEYRNAMRYKNLLARKAFLADCRRLPMSTPKNRRLRLYAERAGRWMARFARTLRV